MYVFAAMACIMGIAGVNRYAGTIVMYPNYT